MDVFSEIINWLKARDLEKYIQDPDGKLIKPKDKQQELLMELEESTVNVNTTTQSEPKDGLHIMKV